MVGLRLAFLWGKELCPQSPRLLGLSPFLHPLWWQAKEQKKDNLGVDLFSPVLWCWGWLLVGIVSFCILSHWASALSPAMRPLTVSSTGRLVICAPVVSHWVLPSGERSVAPAELLELCTWSKHLLQWCKDLWGHIRSTYQGQAGSTMGGSMTALLPVLYLCAKSADSVAFMCTALAVLPGITTAAPLSGTAGVVIRRKCVLPWTQYVWKTCWFLLPQHKERTWHQTPQRPWEGSWCWPDGDLLLFGAPSLLSSNTGRSVVSSAGMASVQL